MNLYSSRHVLLRMPVGSKMLTAGAVYVATVRYGGVVTHVFDLGVWTGAY